MSGTVTGVSSLVAAAEEAGLDKTHVASNTYPWHTFARRNGESLKLHTDRLLSDMASTGVQGYEPIVNGVDELAGLGEKLKRNGLEMRSLYVNSVLHEGERSRESVDSVIAIAEAAKKEVGATIIVTNPSPVRWGGPENKSDDQLRVQAGALDRLGAELHKRGMILAYHNHDAELRLGAREFHHMLTATDPGHVKFCLDAHWVYRGCGDSQVALFDAVEHYHERIVELHLRQS